MRSGANLPRLKPTDGTFAMLLHPNGTGCMEFIRGFYYSVGHLIEPIDWRNRAALLEFQAFADQSVMVCIPENGRITEWSKRNSERRRIVGNDFRGVYLDTIVTVGGPAVREYAVSFAFPRKRNTNLSRSNRSRVSTCCTYRSRSVLHVTAGLDLAG